VNPARVPYPPEAYADDADDDDPYLSTTARRRAAARSASERRIRRDEDVDDDRGTSPLVWLTGIIAIALLAAVAYVVFQFASGATPGPGASPEIVTVPNFVGKQIDTATQEAERLDITLAPTSVESTERAPRSNPAAPSTSRSRRRPERSRSRTSRIAPSATRSPPCLPPAWSPGRRQNSSIRSCPRA
jgi:hypothetical protein